MSRQQNHSPKNRAAMFAFGSGQTVDIAPIDHSAGDAQFLGELPAGSCALRAMLASEIPPLVQGPGAMMLMCRDMDGSILRTIVAMPPHRRKNTAYNVQRAIKKLRRLHPAAGQMFAEMNSGRSQ